MAVTDIIPILMWWVMLFLISISVLPVTTLIFSRFYDKGYIFSRIIGSILLSYLLFVFGIFHLLQFQQGIIVFVLILLSIWSYSSYYYFKNTHFPIIAYFKDNWKLYIFEELLFLGGLFFWSFIRSFNPDIHGLEKYMDYGFINSVLRSTYFPPKDMWFPPFSINYYYFGHITTAVLTKLSGIPSNITYNLMLATIFTECLSASFSLGTNFFASFLKQTKKKLRIKPVLVGILSSLLVTLGGNLHILYAFFKPYENEHPIPPWQLLFSPFSFPNTYWYPNATRFIYNTIHEFPIYSWVVADLHGHVLDIPYVLVTIASIYSLFLRMYPFSFVKEKIGKKKKVNLFQNLLYPRSYFLSLVFVSFLLAIMYMTNAWDGIIYMLLIGLVILSFSITVFFKEVSPLFDKVKIIAPRLVASLAVIVLGFVVFSYPFSRDFKPFVSGIGILCVPDSLIQNISNSQTKSTVSVDHVKIGPLLLEKDHCQKSPLYQLAILYGFFTFFVLGLFWLVMKEKEVPDTDIFALILVLLSILLILLPEFIYVKDIYPAHYRANTMFKLVFQAFMQLSLVSAYVFFRIASEKQLLNTIARKGYLVVGSFLIILVMLYPFLATNNYYGDLKNYQGLDGTTYLKNTYPDDYAAIKWLNSNVSGQPVILEAQGDSYTDYARVSANTGLPTVLGWTVHEWLWRGTYDIPAPRITDVQNLYESKDIDLTKSLLKKYDVRLVYVGTLEKQKYLNLQEEKFKQLGKVIYHKGNATIYQLS